MLACIQDGKIKLEEIYHFENGMKKSCMLKQIFNKPVISHYRHLTCEIIMNNRYVSIVGYY
jgi:hypothetical protein